MSYTNEIKSDKVRLIGFDDKTAEDKDFKTFIIHTIRPYLVKAKKTFNTDELDLLALRIFAEVETMVLLSEYYKRYQIKKGKLNKVAPYDIIIYQLEQLEKMGRIKKKK